MRIFDCTIEHACEKFLRRKKLEMKENTNSYEKKEMNGIRK